MTESNRAPGQSATGVSARVSDGRAALRELTGSHKSRADTTPADHGRGATPDDSGSDGGLPMKLMWAGWSAATPGDDAGQAAPVIEQAVAWQATGARAATVAVTVSARAIHAHAVRAARNAMQQPRKVTHEPLHRPGHVPEGRKGAADVIHGIVAVRDRWC
jgi:hypothetical protein